MNTNTKDITDRETSDSLIKSHRQGCDRYRSCHARICPLETWRTKLIPKKNEEVCYYFREINKAGRAQDEGGKSFRDPHPADPVLSMTHHNREIFITGLSTSEYRSTFPQAHTP